MNNIIEKAKKIQCVICDLDGVLTDGVLYMDNFGNEQKAFHVHDGVGLKLLMAADIQVAVITTSRSAVVDYRMEQLGIQHYLKCKVSKREAYEQLKAKLLLNDEAFAYIGDDLPDLDILRQVGLSVAVADALSLIKEEAAWQTEKNGGRGAVREVCDLILNAQNKYDIAINRFLAQ